MIQLQENAWADGRMEGWKDRKTDRPYFIGPFWLIPGVQKVHIQLKFVFAVFIVALYGSAKRS